MRAEPRCAVAGVPTDASWGRLTAAPGFAAPEGGCYLPARTTGR